MSEIGIWDVDTGKLIRTVNSCSDCSPYWGRTIEIPRMTLSADGRRLLLVDPSKITLWDTQTWKEIMNQDSRDYMRIIDASLSPDGTQIILNEYYDKIDFLYLGK